MKADTVLNLVTLGAVLAVGLLIKLAKTGAEEAVKEGAKAAIRELQWPAELARVLQESRGSERQQLRFKSYGALWHELRPLAIYDNVPFDNASLMELRGKLTDWYFGDCGGLLLTTALRDFYFALQDLLDVAARDGTPWRAERSHGDQKVVFRTILEQRRIAPALGAFEILEKHGRIDWEAKSPALAKEWKDGVRALAGVWSELAPAQRFAVLQQVGSVLRTSMTNDVESRLR
jgi:hypothetical protein